MSLATGLILTDVLVILGGIGMAGFLLWIRNRDSETEHHVHDGVTIERN